MRIYFIAVALFCANISIQMVDYSGVFKPYYSLNAQTGFDTYVNNFADSSYVNAGVEESGLSLGFGDFVRGMDMFTKLIWNSVFGVANLLQLFGLDPIMTLFLRTLMFFIFAGGTIQFIANRRFSGTSA